MTDLILTDSQLKIMISLIAVCKRVFKAKVSFILDGRKIALLRYEK